MASKKFGLGMLVLALAVGLTVVGCDNDTTDGETPPEQVTAAERWTQHWAEGEITMDYSVDGNGVCTVIVGKAGDNYWDAGVGYRFTARANTSYTYKFEAWTQSGNRTLPCVYYWDVDEETGLNEFIDITTERKTYTIYGQTQPKGGIRSIDFHCGDQAGTFFLKILSIEENKTLAITGIPQNLMQELGDANGMIALFSSSTTVEQAFQAAYEFGQTGSFPSSIVAGSTFYDVYTNNAGTIVYFPLYSDWNIPWAGSGSYKIGMFVDSTPPRAFWTPNAVNFSSGTTTITFNTNWEVPLQ